jgi:hypothetical protein
MILFSDPWQNFSSAKGVTQGLPRTLAGTGCFFGFFASLVLRCCPLAMFILLVVKIHKLATTQMILRGELLLLSLP